TMEETAFFLSLTTGGCTPVVITGAMRQANATGADGPANLLNAVRIAVAPASRGRGTMVLMNDEIFAARDVVKSNSTRPNAFTAPDAGVLGIADPDTIVYHRAPPAGSESSRCRSPVFDLASVGSFPRVDIAYAYIGSDSVVVDALVAAGARGIVVAGVGRGGSTPAMGQALRRAVDKGVIVVMGTRTGSGRVSPETEPDSLAALSPGRGAMLGASDLNAQKARVLLMLGLAAHMELRTLAQLFEQR
ncbi:MAG: asparaginase, partial [Gemmatimonadaceae bacterium]